MSCIQCMPMCRTLQSPCQLRVFTKATFPERPLRPFGTSAPAKLLLLLSFSWSPSAAEVLEFRPEVFPVAPGFLHPRIWCTVQNW